MKKEINPKHGVAVRAAMAATANSTEFLKLKERLADIAAKTRINNLELVQPSLMRDLLNSHKQASAMLSDDAKLYGSGAFSAGQVLKDLGKAVAKYSAINRRSTDFLVPGRNILALSLRNG
ncbi:hypothetical protein [Dyadobacter sp. 3J3]|uniref:hypothetical protein n=1 Tax=Dyadobacter sp. 3J3 TaxID=2606600 RepID=UPI001359067A|nr:hypothetical protein [Dyadobacter sp. 3J3]